MKRIIVFIVSILIFTPLVFSQNLEQKAKNGNVQAMYDLAKEYYSGIGRLENKANALVWFERAANKNHIESMYRTAQMYEKGITTNVNLRKAFNFYLLAAEKGHEASQLIVAQKLEKGEGVTKSDSRAYLWYRVSAERKEVLAWRKMGDYFRDGKVVMKDHIQAKFWYDKAVQENDLESKSSLAYLYVANEGIAPKPSLAKELNKEPLQKQIPLSYFVEGMINLYDKSQENDRKAFENLSRAHSLGISQADYPLAMMYFRGEGTRRNLPKAFEIMETLPMQYDSEVGYLMGKTYQQGDEDIDIEINKAIESYKKAANANNVEACLELEKIYTQGLGVRKNLKEARLWKNKAFSIENPQLGQSKK
ncbi:MAG: tetratricopeptide repeat protein [Bacteroidales bacterium]|mgnify:CR=1 FL=1|jgi:TPR repeat protein|nr:tetratricopeptide repeat protein [Bacteroidales bacterium]MDD4703948.1 tetratricopeptide repeat protein [Bacteroidales bacterium]MDX9799595.1 tetratricopeptide repeat protein [Bacteroidales bacterium]